MPSAPDVYTVGETLPPIEEVRRTLSLLRDSVEFDLGSPDSIHIIETIGSLAASLGITEEAPRQPHLHIVSDAETATTPAMSPERRMARSKMLVDNYLAAFDADGMPLPDGPASSFRPLKHQPEMFRDIGIALQTEQYPDGSVRFGIRGAPSVGKAVVLSVAALAMGLGDRAAENEPPLSGLYLTSSVNNMDQVARDEARGLRRFAPDLDVGVWYAKEKSVRDLTVMTDQSFAMMSDETFQSLMERIDVIMIDECHRAYGPMVKERLLKSMPGRIIIPASATLDFSDRRTLASELDVHKLAVDIGFRESIERKIGNGARIITLATENQVEIAHSDGISEADLEPLLDDESRNKLIVDGIRYAVERGLTGIVQCVRGGGSRHARDIAALANSSPDIYDPVRKLWRPMRAEAVGDFQSRDDNKAILRAFANGEVDALTFCKYLIEGYDEERVGFVYMTEPMTSIVNVDQLFGRGSRPKDRLTLYMQLLDTYKGRGRPVRIFLDTVGENVIQQGVVLGAPVKPNDADPESSQDSEPQSAEDFLESLPESLGKAARKVEGRIVSELTVVGLAYEDPPADWPLATTLPIFEQMTAKSAMALLRRHNVPLIQKNRGEWYVPPDCAELIAGADITIEEGDIISFSNFRKHFNLSDELGVTIIRQVLGSDFIPQRHPTTNKPIRYISLQDRERARDYLEQKYPPLDDEYEIPLAVVATRAGRNLTNVRLAAADNNIGTYTRYTDRRQKVECISNSDLSNLEAVLQSMGRYLASRKASG